MGVLGFLPEKWQVSFIPTVETISCKISWQPRFSSCVEKQPAMRKTNEVRIKRNIEIKY